MADFLLMLMLGKGVRLTHISPLQRRLILDVRVMSCNGNSSLGMDGVVVLIVDLLEHLRYLLSHDFSLKIVWQLSSESSLVLRSCIASKYLDGEKFASG